MKKVLIVAIALLPVISCSKKSTPSSSTGKTTEAQKTDGGTAAVSTEVKPDNPAPAESAEVMAGHSTYKAKCGRCHGLKDPGAHSVAQWNDIIAKMAPKAKLDSAERANVTAYVNFYAKKG
ncbi:MAG: cytochrome c [Ferruginibacter sp.]|jgi:cytochrome c5